jgi:hypothetical protein
MKLFINIFVFFAFIMGASGLAKTAASHNALATQTISTSSLSQTSQESASKCCAIQQETEIKSPRCIGDICTQSSMEKPRLLGFGYKLPFITLANTVLNTQHSFLRPPIT